MNTTNTTATATATTIRTINATVTAYGEESCDWAGYVAERLAETYPGVDIEVSYGRRNEAVADGEPLADFAAALTGWWDDLCSQPDHPAWGEDEEDVEVQVEVASVRPSSEGDYEAQVSITVGDETYEGTVTLREDTSRPSGGRRLGTCGAPLDGWASDRVIDALAAAEGAGLDRVAIVGEIEAHVTEAAARRAEPPASDPRYAVLVCGHIVGRYDSLAEAEAEADRLNADGFDDIVGDMSTCTLPEHLHPAYNWTDSAGEIDELRTRTGDQLAEYCRESAANASEHDEDDVTESDLLELAEWLKLDYVRSLTPGQAWDEFVGEQSTREFEELCDGEPIEQAVERYLADMREQRTGFDWSLAEGKSEEYAARLLVRHIEANRAD